MTSTSILPNTAQSKAVAQAAGVPNGTLLLVEDSRAASDLIRLVFRGAGGRLRRVDTLDAAKRHLALYTPDMAIVDLGLPDGSGLDLIRQMNLHRPRVPLIVAVSGLPDARQGALAAGADHFIAKPFDDLASLRATLARVFYPLRGADMILGRIVPGLAACRDDLILAHDLLCGTRTTAARDYALHFTQGLAQVLRDDVLAQAVADARQTDRLSPLAALLSHYLRRQPLV